jgi:NADPH-dependent 2,4-dienoyl-CoA reductase/sulfur reductase-like enzyme
LNAKDLKNTVDSNINSEVDGKTKGSDTRIVVVGASHAGISFVEQMRKHGFAGSLTLIDRQKGGPMERPPLSKAFLLEATDQVNPMFLLKRGKWYKEQDIKLKHGMNVTDIDASAQNVKLSNGEQLEFDKLVLATGAVPRSLPATDGMSNVYVLRQPDDAIAIRATARSVKSAVIIGGGYIGLEVAASLRKMGLEVSVIEMADRLLARVASPPVAKLLNDLHAEHGVFVYTGVSVDKIIDSDGKFTGVTLADGTALSGEMLIVGIGVIPDSELAQQAGVETERPDGGAILVNTSMQTSNPNIIAMGDVALQRGHSLRIESVHNAQDTAARAAAAIMSETPPIEQAPWFWSDQYDANLQSVGIVPTGDNDIYQITRPGEHKSSVSFWSYRDQELIAVEAVRDSKNFMLGKKCLENNFSPNPNNICDPDYDPNSDMT